MAFRRMTLFARWDPDYSNRYTYAFIRPEDGLAFESVCVGCESPALPLVGMLVDRVLMGSVKGAKALPV